MTLPPSSSLVIATYNWPEALALVAYLQSLNSQAPLYSAPFPLVPTNAPAAK